jgi:hypothetical protein
MTSIKSGVAPFTRSYKPEQPLSTYDVKEVSGNWILKVQDDAISQVGTLQSWCITINYFDLSVGQYETALAKSFILGQNFPNPVVSLTQIPFTLSAPGMADIDLYDLFGRKVLPIASGFFAGGFNVINVDLSGLPSGTYFYRLVQGDDAQTKVLLLNR